ncbi:MAG TPA: hypothetical protein VHG69_05840 [Thermoleophilaceae bacterium]|nr:hypothetical protein [Thermoleophilaceae bacterium]
MPTVEVSRTLVKSPPELWSELQGERLRQALGPNADIKSSEDERLLAWECEDASGTACLEPSGWGTKVILRAEVQEQVEELEPEVARWGVWARMRSLRQPPPPPPDPGPRRHEQLEQAFEELLDELGSAHRKPFQGS